jgi:dsDNA-specific endonuclease/ATPase MutS2
VKKKNTVSKKNKKDWEDFTKQIGDIHPKEDDLLQQDIIIGGIKKLDLHGSSLNDANHKVKEFVNESFEQGYRKLLIITGKGSRSKVDENPYVSEKFGVLKYSVPEFIRNEENLNKKVIKISVAEKKHGGDGAIYVFLKSKKNIKE